jgi:hypothetical protein
MSTMRYGSGLPANVRRHGYLAAPAMTRRTELAASVNSARPSQLLPTALKLRPGLQLSRVKQRARQIVDGGAPW